jgi:hypothetical protein
MTLQPLCLDKKLSKRWVRQIRSPWSKYNFRVTRRIEFTRDCILIGYD